MITSTEAAKKIRHDLRQAFPGQKISVRTDRGTASGWLHITWDTDTPTTEQVREIASRYQGRQFNGLTDGYDERGVDSMVDGILYMTSGGRARR